MKALPPSLATPPKRLGLHHLAYLRAIAQGLDRVEMARRYLGVDHGREAEAAHRRVVDLVAAIVRRRGDPRWRLLGIDLRPVEGSGTPPTLDEWAEAEGLGGLRESELLELYAEHFDEIDPDTRRRQERNARLIDKRLALLRELEAVAAEPARPEDRIDAWLDEWLTEPRMEALRDAGVLTLADLQRCIARGGRWWRVLPAYGPIKAARLAGFVEILVGKASVPAWPVMLDAAALSGRHGANRAVDTPAAIDADDDRKAVRAWVAARSGSPATARQYQSEAERFLLWCVLERGKALSDTTAEDCRAYMDFIADVPDRWIGLHRVDRLAPGWAPFKGSLSLVSQKRAIAALHSLFGWLVQAGYLLRNPWVLVNRKLGDDAGRLDGNHDATSRAFTPEAWRALLDHLDDAEPSPSVDRLRWLCLFVECTGLRASELLGARLEHLHPARDGWVVRVHGKGRKNRAVPVPARGVKATRAYFAARGLDLDTAPLQTPLLASLVSPSAPISYPALHETFTRFVRRALTASRLTAAKREHALQASSHWLRHTHATRAAEQEVPLDVLQEGLGQADPRTTAGYYRPQMQRRQRVMEKAFPDEGEA